MVEKARNNRFTHNRARIGKQVLHVASVALSGLIEIWKHQDNHIKLVQCLGPRSLSEIDQRSPLSQDIPSLSYGHMHAKPCSLLQFQRYLDVLHGRGVYASDMSEDLILLDDIVGCPPLVESPVFVGWSRIRSTTSMVELVICIIHY